ncbi:MAG TPA: hypothetical protein VFP68_07555, partial [Burkholderiaceae bacterium]|nr:hypothetical protein [Burkholderiaceae bacterium]
MSVPIVVTAFGHPESHSAFTNAAGAAAAALLVSRLAPNTWFKSNGPVFGLVFFTLVMSAAARAATAESFALFAAAIVVFQAAIQGHNLYHRVERLKHIPPARFSQVLGALYLTFLLPLPLSGLAVRLIGPAISYRELILGATAAASLVGAVCYFSIFNLHRQKTVNA